MPGPPTPVSGCPLKQLEIQSGPNSRIYDSTQPANALTLTLEGQHSVDEQKATLVLLVHAGSRRMVSRPTLYQSSMVLIIQQLSIKLSDLITAPQATSDAISVDKQLQQLRIKIKAQHHVINAEFDEKRDFNVAVCMLKKSGFSINYHTNESQGAIQSSTPTSTFTFEPPADFGPRLSSIAPLQGYDPAPRHELYSPSLLGDLSSHLQIPNPSHQAWQSGAEASSQNNSQLTPYMPHLNPYNVFLGKQYDHYRPRVSSPLRNAIQPASPSGPHPNPFHGTPPQLVSRSGLLSRRVTYTAVGSPEAQADYQWDLDHHQEAYSQPGAQLGHYVSYADTTNETPLMRQRLEQLSLSQPAESFREIMPQPRNLPFLQRSKTSTRDYSTSSTDLEDSESPQVRAQQRKRESPSSDPRLEDGEYFHTDQSDWQRKRPRTSTTTEQEHDDPFDWLDRENKAKSITFESRAGPAKSVALEPLRRASSAKNNQNVRGKKQDSPVKRKIQRSPRHSTKQATRSVTSNTKAASKKAAPRQKASSISPRSRPSPKSRKKTAVSPSVTSKAKPIAKKAVSDRRTSANSPVPRTAQSSHKKKVNSHIVTKNDTYSPRLTRWVELDRPYTPNKTNPTEIDRLIQIVETAKAEALNTPRQTGKMELVNLKEIVETAKSERLKNADQSLPPSQSQNLSGSLIVTRSRGKLPETPKLPESPTWEPLQDEASATSNVETPHTEIHEVSDSDTHTTLPQVLAPAPNPQGNKAGIEFYRESCDVRFSCSVRVPNGDNATSQVETSGEECQMSSSAPIQDTTPASDQTQCQSALKEPDPAFLVTDEMLRQVNKVTSKILDQYEADVKRGCDKAERAQFYMDRVMAARTEFWYAKLTERETGIWLTAM